MQSSSAASVYAALEAIASEQQKGETARFFFDGLGETKVLGVQIGAVFPVAKAHRDLSIDEISRLLESPYYEVRMTGVAIMDFQARQKSAANPLSVLYDLYISRHDRINNWDFVDRAAPHVVGQFLEQRSRSPLYDLADSPDPWRRRTAIVATWWFIRQGGLEDTFAISARLTGDRHPMIEKALGSWLRAAGEVDRDRLQAFLITHRDKLSATTLRMATEKFAPDERAALRKS